MIKGSFRLTSCDIVFFTDVAIIAVIATYCLTLFSWFSTISLCLSCMFTLLATVFWVKVHLLVWLVSTCPLSVVLSTRWLSLSLTKVCIDVVPLPDWLLALLDSWPLLRFFFFVVVSYIEIICLFSFYSVSFYLVSFCCSINSFIISLIKRILLRCYSSWPTSCTTWFTTFVTIVPIVSISSSDIRCFLSIYNFSTFYFFLFLQVVVSTSSLWLHCFTIFAFPTDSRCVNSLLFNLAVRSPTLFFWVTIHQSTGQTPTLLSGFPLIDSFILFNWLSLVSQLVKSPNFLSGLPFIRFPFLFNGFPLVMSRVTTLELENKFSLLKLLARLSTFTKRLLFWSRFDCSPFLATVVDEGPSLRWSAGKHWLVWMLEERQPSKNKHICLLLKP